MQRLRITLQKEWVESPETLALQLAEVGEEGLGWVGFFLKDFHGSNRKHELVGECKTKV